MKILLLDDTILSFHRWDSWHPLPSRVYRTLLSRQRSLTELELNHTELALDELYGYGPTSLLNNEMPLKRLRIMPGPGEALSQAACELFEAHREISHLTLDLYHLRKDDEVGWDDPSTANGALLRQLFRTVEPSISRLRILELNSVDLRGSHDTIGSGINPECLKELVIANCPNAEKFLMAANKKLEKRGPLGLTRFVLYHARVWQPPNHAAGADDNMGSMDLVEELSTFLGSTSKSLRELWVGLRGYDELPIVSSIVSHGPTLEWLFLDVRVLKAAPAATYSLGQWQELCNSLKVVRQVDAAYPSVVADCHLENYEEFSEFVVSAHIVLLWHTQARRPILKQVNMTYRPQQPIYPRSQPSESTIGLIRLELTWMTHVPTTSEGTATIKLIVIYLQLSPLTFLAYEIVRDRNHRPTRRPPV